jgi:hypothetical protein
MTVERRGCVEIRWSDDDPDDVVAPWPKELDGTPIEVHVERMSDDAVWMAIYDPSNDSDVHMWLRAKKGKLVWTVRD